MTGLRLDTATSKLRKRLGKLRDSCQASEFRPELERFASDTLKDCIAATPVRAESLITAAQTKQYANRINYIPSVHTLNDPTLIVNEQGEPWIYSNGKWYNGNWRLPSDVFAEYSQLNEERERRMLTARSEFIAQRKQARFLYQRSWWQVAQSLGLALAAAAQIVMSKTRRKPIVEPPKAYGQWRGGKQVISVVIVNPFLDVQSRYWKGNGKKILAQSTAKNRARFYKSVDDKVKRNISRARQTA